MQLGVQSLRLLRNQPAWQRHLRALSSAQLPSGGSRGDGGPRGSNTRSVRRRAAEEEATLGDATGTRHGKLRIPHARLEGHRIITSTHSDTHSHIGTCLVTLSDHVVNWVADDRVMRCEVQEGGVQAGSVSGHKVLDRVSWQTDDSQSRLTSTW